jgi:hypothetical protein
MHVYTTAAAISAKITTGSNVHDPQPGADLI